MLWLAGALAVLTVFVLGVGVCLAWVTAELKRATDLLTGDTR